MLQLPRFVRPANAPTALSRCSRNPIGQRRERHDILSGSRKTTARERLCSTKESLSKAFPAPQKTFVAGAWETHEFGDTGRFSSASCPNFSSTRATLLGQDSVLEQRALEGAGNFCDSPQWPKYLNKPRPNTVSWCVPWLAYWPSGLLTGNLACLLTCLLAFWLAYWQSGLLTGSSEAVTAGGKSPMHGQPKGTYRALGDSISSHRTVLQRLDALGTSLQPTMGKAMARGRSCSATCV